MVSPCYRLIPEATGSQILEDVGSFWCWVRNSLSGAVSKRWHLLSVDFDRVAAAGPGSGGVLALQSALLWPETRINIIMGQYCGIYPDNTAFNPKPPQPLDEYEEFVNGCLARVKPGTFRVSSPWPEYFDLAKAAIETGRWRDLLREDKALELRDRLRESKELPPVWIVQGAQDRLVCSLKRGGLSFRHEIANMILTIGVPSSNGRACPRHTIRAPSASGAVHGRPRWARFRHEDGSRGGLGSGRYIIRKPVLGGRRDEQQPMWKSMRIFWKAKSLGSLAADGSFHAGPPAHRR